MSRIIAISILLIGICLNANADVWRWTDANGITRFVSSSKPLYTWVDESGKVHYSDKPDHEDAVSVELVWHSIGEARAIAKSESTAAKSDAKIEARPGETDSERNEREMAEAYYCKRAKDVYDSYVKAPRLYETDSAGKRVYLDDQQMAAKLAETESAVAQLCNGTAAQ